MAASDDDEDEDGEDLFHELVLIGCKFGLGIFIPVQLGLGISYRCILGPGPGTALWRRIVVAGVQSEEFGGRLRRPAVRVGACNKVDTTREIAIGTQYFWSPQTFLRDLIFP